MQKRIITTLLSACLAIWGTAQAQSNIEIKDGFDLLMKRSMDANPNFRSDFSKLNADIKAKAAVMLKQNSANKTTATREVAIVFHIVLTADQITQIGGTAGIEERVQSQLEALNNDFNAANADSVLIPAAFKPLYGNMNIKFSLAHKDPKGNYSPGYEIITTTKSGFDIQSGTIGTKYYCSDAKFASTGGADAWDTKRYINVWVLNITPNGVGGVGTPPPHPEYGGTGMFPWNEQGIAIVYWAFGKQSKAGQYFPAAAAKAGRTLVHEMGHYFNLFHPFGMSTMDNKTCTDDDGVDDTPLESGPTQSICPTFPLLDTCSKTFPGVMFMNHMDYSADTCRHMFTIDQAARVNVELAPGGFREQILNNPDLIYMWPSAVNTVNENAAFVVYPNPASANCTVRFNDAQSAMQVMLINSLGQVVRTAQPAKGENFVNIDLTGIAKGIYIIKCNSNNVLGTHRLSVN